MDNIRDIKTRIKSVREIQKITRAMKMVATAKYKKSHRRLQETKSYISEVETLLLRVKKEVVLRYNPYCCDNAVAEKNLVVLVTADKGLCGGFNSNLIKTVLRSSEKFDLYVIGKKGRAFFIKHDEINLVGDITGVFGTLDFKSSRKIVGEIKKGFLESKYRSVKVVYTGFESMGRQPITEQQILPMTPLIETIEQDVPAKRMIFEDSYETVFNNLLEHYLELRFFKVLLESELSEHIIRMNAMEAATTNASELIDGLVLAYNRARQSVITKEILEIVGGAEALNK